ncbi:hypothetical protein IJG78_02670 [Candidatus Saccharibacteria bacterium]|nr:hypothetical protein [Candidatus Saccharibacteria bacterium]
MIKDLIKLYKERRELTLLEITYFTLSVITFAVAGIIALFNQSLGVSILIVPLIALIAGVVNIVAWSVVKLVIESLINRKNADKAADKPAKTIKK